MIRIRRTISAPPLRACALACVLLGAVAGPAVADERSTAAVDKLVRAHIAASITTEGAYLRTITPGAHVTRPDGYPASNQLMCVDDPRSCGDSFNLYEATGIYGTYKYSAVSKPAVYVDDAHHVAFFQASVKLSVDGSRGEELDVPVKGKTTMRITGIAVQEQGAWKIAAVAYAPSLPESRLLALAERTAIRRLAPYHPVAKEVMAWGGHLAEHMSPHAIGAAGTAPKSLVTKPEAMTALAKGWDQLPLEFTDLAAEVHGDAAFLWGTAWRKVGDEAVRLSLILLIERDGGSWKWVAISLAPHGAFEEALVR